MIADAAVADHAAADAVDGRALSVQLGHKLWKPCCRPACARKRARGAITLLSLAPEVKEETAGRRSYRKNNSRLSVSSRPIRSRSNRGQLAQAAELHAGADHGTAPQRNSATPTTQRISSESETRTGRHTAAALELNADQQAALAAILDPLRAPRHETILIHGVTGSGKTEVYIQAIEEVISYGRQAIMLVPEISLTPQTERAVSQPVRSSRRAAQPSARRGAALALGADCPRRSASGRRRPQRRVCAGAAFGFDRAGRRARRFVQARQCAAVPCPRRGFVASARGKRAAGAGLGHAVAGKLVSGEAGRISTGRNAAARVRSSAAGGGTIDLRE